MKKTEYFNHVLSVIADVTELSAEEIMSRGRCEELVNARLILIYIFYDEGYYPKQIAKMIGRTPEAVTRMIACFDDRIKTDKQLRFNYEAVVRKLQRN